MANSRTNEQDFTIEIYKNLLKSYIIERQLPLQQIQIEIEKYIAVFSLYLQNTNDAYKYNLPYLSHQNKRFASFLVSASQKNEELRHIIDNVKRSEDIKKHISDNIIEEKDLEISINDFLTADLSGKINFHKSFLLSGAERANKKDIITIAYKQQVRTVKIQESSKYEQIINMVIKLLSLETGGEK